MKIFFEQYRGDTSKIILNHDFLDSELAEVDLDETGNYLISLELEQGERVLSATLNQLDLNITSWDRLVVLDLEDFNDPLYKSKSKPNDFIFYTFRNRAGRVLLEIELEEIVCRVHCHVEPKYSNYLEWYNTVFLQFPLIQNPSSLGSASSIRSSLFSDYFFPSRFDFLNKVSNAIERLSSGIHRPGYLKKKYTLASIEKGLGGRPDKAIKQVLQNKVTWQRAPLTSTSLARRGIQSFEPQIFAKQTTSNDFNNTDNQRFLRVALKCAEKIRKQAVILREKEAYVHDVRAGGVSSFETKKIL
ncbi:Chainlength determinant protein [Candidatus Micropelagos thuwalensis]|uniref:Chainlength determinant protein n=1 Tax=Candidatus Micropelagius thuwalensis TaxID=1397666 RepID=U2XRR7_9PROT|nr:hypothetical protein [Candidatus Micropelagos thuwalensis]ERL47782.1 Chainlength determinant protein [Candidatus Micropelagos thuwalensis]